MQHEAYGRIRGTLASARSLWSGIAHRLSAFWSVDGEYIYENDWDLLIVLDACRVDALSQVADEYSFLSPEIPTVTSLAPNSALWLERNFIPRFREEIAGTTYVSGNGHTETFVDGDSPIRAEEFERLERVYDYAFDETAGTVRPSEMTDAAVRTVRGGEQDRAIVHYMQPHTPYRSLDTDAIGGVQERQFRETVWDLIAAGEITNQEAWEAYLDTLRWGLDSVELLLKSVDAERVIITADHGECFGEWGAYGHSAHGTFDVLRTVPWVECTATNESGYKPNGEEEAETVSVEEQLEYLGYR